MPPSDQWSKVPDLNMRGSEADSGDELEYDYAKLLAERAFDFHNSPAKPDPLIKLNGKTICTPGNISNIQASAKAGKTSVIGGILAAVCVGERRGRDTFGFEAYNRFQHAVLHFDTEQSSFDHNANIHQALKRADVKEPPPWFHSYCLTGIDPDDIEKSVMCALDLAAQKHGGVFLVVIDGIADLCSNPNDATDAFRLVAELQRAAITHNCAILTVLHENPGSDYGKTRGHLGSQIERKAETSLRLAKDANSGVVTIWAEKARHCMIPKSEGQCIHWDDDTHGFVSCGHASDLKKHAKQDKEQRDASAAFGSVATLTHGNLCVEISRVSGVGKEAAKKRIKTWTEAGLIQKLEGGGYALVAPPSLAALSSPSSGCSLLLDAAS